MAGIYLHVPFCRSKCAYCDFYSVARPELAGAYAAAVGREFAARRGELGCAPVTTLYFGGGTPSQLPPDIFCDLASLLHTPEVEEFTAEANPDDITPELLGRWVDAGVNRVSLGVQSLQDAELRAVNRRHDAAGALRAIDTIHRAGITDVSADLIYGLPGQTRDSFADSLRRLVDSGITHLSAYCLSYEEGTLLWRRREQGLVDEMSDDDIADIYGDLCRMASEAGFEHYEISNFARRGRRARHNSAYWRGIPYLGLGPGAHSLDVDGLRRYNRPDLRSYISAPASVLTPDPVDREEHVNELILTGVRTAEGVSLADIPAPYRAEVLAAADAHLRRGTLTRSADDRLVIPEARWLLSDAIIRDLLI